MTYGQPEMNPKKIEARMKLRKLELEAYSALINAFRAQGSFSKEKKRILLELRSYLSISIERHQAEIRRSVNDDKLSRISFNLNGEDKLDGWVIEGRRVIPLLKRMAPKTAVSAIADNVARYQVKKNEQEKLAVNDDSFESQINHNRDQFDHSTLNREDNSLKRSNSSESLDSKRKYIITSSSTNKLMSNQVKLIERTPASLDLQQRTENAIITTAVNTINDKQSKQPKLLVMSTPGSMINNKIHNHPINTIQNHNSFMHQQQSPLSSNHQLIDNRIELNEIKSSNKSTCILPVSETVNQIITTSSTAKIYNPKVQTTSSASSPKLMILPNSTSGGQQTKTLTIPISHNVKTLQLPAQNSTILYSTQQPIVSSNALNCTTSALKAMPGITIQTIKAQGGNKSNNFIIMPNNKASNNTSTQAKGLLRQMNAKEFPLKFISTTAPQTRDQSNDKGDLIDTINQPTIILTNVSKETANSLAAGTSSSIGNLIKNQNLSAHPNIIKGIKVIPKCQATNLTSNQNQLSAAGKVNNKANPSNQKAITIPATFMEILKNIPINRIASPHSPNDQSKNTISITQNPNSSLTKTSVLKIPPNATTESITKLIFSNVISSNVNSGQPVANVCSSSKVASTGTPVTRTETKKITLITKNSGSSTLECANTQLCSNDKVQSGRIAKVETDSRCDESVLTNCFIDNQLIFKKDEELMRDEANRDVTSRENVTTESS